ncbi:MAG: acyl--CoA ligase [Clostridia bacterium]|nr:acyl--CoA ligase [Clostridia bacterium]
MSEKNEIKNIGDMPWDVSVFEYFRSKAEKFSDYNALSYYNINITYAQLMKKIDIVYNALLSMGIGKGDVVVVSLPAIPEAVYLFYAVNRLGGIYCGMDCRSTECEIKETLERVQPKVCFVADFHLPEFKNIMDIPIVCIRSTNSIGGFTVFTSCIADVFTGRSNIKRKNSKILAFSQFLAMETCEKKEKAENITGDDVCAYFYTSGTTYGRKCAVLTNRNINMAVWQHSQSEVDYEVGDIMCNIMPLFTCYGTTLGVHLPLIMGISVRLIPLFSARKMKSTLLKYSPNYIITVPSHWEFFETESFDNCDLSFLKCVIVGGDRVDAEYEDRVNSIFEKCNSKAFLMIGYGLTETASTATWHPKHTPKGSVGIPTLLTKICIVDTETNEVVPCGEKGEICIAGPTVFKGYLNDISSTESMLKIHRDGKLWLHSGDIGYVDSEGYIYFCERIKRMFVRYDGTKVSPYAIEQMILGCSAVKSCLVLAVDDTEHSHGKCPVAVVVPKGSNHPKIKQEINTYIRRNLPEHLKPKEVVCVEKLPKTKNGKLDYFYQDIFDKYDISK